MFLFLILAIRHSLPNLLKKQCSLSILTYSVMFLSYLSSFHLLLSPPSLPFSPLPSPRLASPYLTLPYLPSLPSLPSPYLPSPPLPSPFRPVPLERIDSAPLGMFPRPVPHGEMAQRPGGCDEHM